MDDLGKLVLRVTLGALLLFHGVDKLTGGIDPIVGMVTARGWPALLAWGVYAGEVLGPLLVIVGLFTRLGALLILGNMLDQNFRRAMVVFERETIWSILWGRPLGTILLIVVILTFVGSIMPRKRKKKQT